MKYNKTFFILIFVLILMCSFALAVKPSQVSTADEGYDIRIPQGEIIEQNTNIKLGVHVFNRSDGLLVTNASVDCFIHIYNSTGDHILIEPLGFSDFDFTLIIDGNNFTETGFYSFIIQCNSTVRGGFVSGSVIITKTGNANPTSSDYVYPVLISLIVVLAIFLILAIITSEETILKNLWFSMTIIMTSVILFIGNIYSQEMGLFSALTERVFVGVALLFAFIGFLMMASFMISIYRNYRDESEENHLANEMWRKR